MAANYDLYRNPPVEGTDEQQPLHARIVPKGTMHLDYISSLLTGFSSFSSGDIIGLLTGLSKVTSLLLSQGYNVELDGFGFFSVSLACPPVMEKQDVHAQSVSFNGINFRASADFKRQVREKLTLERDEDSSRESYTDKKRESRLVWYLDTYEYISCRKYMGLNQCSKAQAIRDLNKWIDAGHVKRIGEGTSTLYCRTKPVKKEEEAPKV